MTSRLDQIESILAQLAEEAQTSSQERQQLRENLATLNEITIGFMSVTREAIVQLQQNVVELRAGQERLEQNVVELRAGQEQHSRMLDVLIRNQQNG
jgi:septal ring factor EnvC (AmiA/AmiB activator)